MKKEVKKVAPMQRVTLPSYMWFPIRLAPRHSEVTAKLFSGYEAKARWNDNRGRWETVPYNENAIITHFRHEAR